MAFDQKLWDANGCACRCLIEFARRRGKHIDTPQDLYNRYAPTYRIWEKKPGITDNLLFAKIVMDYKLARAVATYIDAARIVTEIQSGTVAGIFGFTERMPKDSVKPEVAITYHVLLLTPDANGHNMTAWDPKADGSAQEYPVLWSDWSSWLMRGVLFYE